MTYKKRTFSGKKSIHERRVASYRIEEQKWKDILLPQLYVLFYLENKPPRSQSYLSAKNLPDVDLIYERLDAERGRHREVTIRMSKGDSFRFVMLYKRWARRRFKNVHVQLQKDGQGGILISWDGIPKRWK